MHIDLKPNERTALVRGIFSRIVPRYDLLNHTLSLGRDYFWRRATARRVSFVKTGHVLDIACGTADLCLAIAEEKPGFIVTGTDFTYPMLVKGQEKISAKKNRRIALSCGDALHLPFRDARFDAATMAFGIRNIPDKRQALSEMRRVLVPGGKALILELTFPRWSYIRKFYTTYLNRLIPRLGGMVSGNSLAYQYLADSIMDFPAPDEFQSLLESSGFNNTGYKKFTFGIAVLHWGLKPAA